MLVKARSHVEPVLNGTCPFFSFFDAFFNFATPRQYFPALRPDRLTLVAMREEFGVFWRQICKLIDKYANYAPAVALLSDGLSI